MTTIVYHFYTDLLSIVSYDTIIDPKTSASIAIPMNPLEFYAMLVTSDIPPLSPSEVQNTQPYLQIINTQVFYDMLQTYIELHHIPPNHITVKTRKFYLKPFDVIQQSTILPSGTTFSLYHFYHL